MNRRFVLSLLRFLLSLCVLLSASAASNFAKAQTQSQGKPLAYLRSHIGQDPYALWKTQPLQRRLSALLGPAEYKSFIGNLDPATDLAEQQGILHVAGNAPHRGGEEEAILLVDVENDTIEVFIRHKTTIVRAWAENNRLVLLPRDVITRLKSWPSASLTQALAGLQQAARRKAL